MPRQLAGTPKRLRRAVDEAPPPTASSPKLRQALSAQRQPRRCIACTMAAASRRRVSRPLAAEATLAAAGEKTTACSHCSPKMPGCSLRACEIAAPRPRRGRRGLGGVNASGREINEPKIAAAVPHLPPSAGPAPPSGRPWGPSCNAASRCRAAAGGERRAGAARSRSAARLPWQCK